MDKPKHNTLKIQVPPKEDLIRKYDVEQKSIKTISREYKVSNATVSKWFDELKIPRREMYTAQALAFKKRREKIVTDTPLEEQTSEDNQADPFLSLSDIKKNFILLVGDIEQRNITQAEVCTKLDISHDTYERYMKDNIVIEAIKQYKVYHARMKLERKFYDDLLDRYEGVAGKRLEKEDRQLVARMFGVETMPSVSINANVKDSRLKKLL